MCIRDSNTIGKDKISKRSYELKAYLRDKVKDNQQFRLKTPELDELSCGIQTLEVVGKNVRDVRNSLRDDYHIDVRPMTTYGLNGIRISLAIFITKKDIDYLIDALETIAG